MIILASLLFLNLLCILPLSPAVTAVAPRPTFWPHYPLSHTTHASIITTLTHTQHIHTSIPIKCSDRLVVVLNLNLLLLTSPTVKQMHTLPSPSSINMRSGANTQDAL